MRLSHSWSYWTRVIIIIWEVRYGFAGLEFCARLVLLGAYSFDEMEEDLLLERLYFEHLVLKAFSNIVVARCSLTWLLDLEVIGWSQLVHIIAYPTPPS